MEMMPMLNPMKLPAFATQNRMFAALQPQTRVKPAPTNVPSRKVYSKKEKEELETRRNAPKLREVRAHASVTHIFSEKGKRKYLFEFINVLSLLLEKRVKFGQGNLLYAAIPLKIDVKPVGSGWHRGRAIATPDPDGSKREKIKVNFPEKKAEISKFFAPAATIGTAGEYFHPHSLVSNNKKE